MSIRCKVDVTPANHVPGNNHHACQTAVKSELSLNSLRWSSKFSGVDTEKTKVNLDQKLEFCFCPESRYSSLTLLISSSEFTRQSLKF